VWAWCVQFDRGRAGGGPAFQSGGVAHAWTYLSLLLAPLLGEAGPGGRSLSMFRRVCSSGASAPSALSLMVLEYQMSGGVSTAAAIPFQALRGRRWMMVRGFGCAGGCHHQF
jgi:hypothetical protein